MDSLLSAPACSRSSGSFPSLELSAGLGPEEDWSAADGAGDVFRASVWFGVAGDGLVSWGGRAVGSLDKMTMPFSPQGLYLVYIQDIYEGK